MSSPWRPFTPAGALEGESFRLLRPKKVNKNFHGKSVPKNPKKGQQNFSSVFQKKTTKIALGTGISPEKTSFHLKFGQKSLPPQPKSPGDAYVHQPTKFSCIHISFMEVDAAGGGGGGGADLALTQRQRDEQ